MNLLYPKVRVKYAMVIKVWVNWLKNLNIKSLRLSALNYFKSNFSTSMLYAGRILNGYFELSKLNM